MEPRVADVLDARNYCTTLFAANFHCIHPWTMWRMTIELLPAGDSSLLQFLFATDDLEGTTLWTIVVRQPQSPEAFLGDHQVIHIAQPIPFAIPTEVRVPWYM